MEDEEVDSDCEDGSSIIQPRKCFKVKEESDEEEHSEIDSVNDLSNDRIKDVEEVEATLLPK